MSVTYGGDRYKTFDQSSTDAGAPPVETTIKLNFLEIENYLSSCIFNSRRFAMSNRLSVDRIKQIIREEKSKIEKESLISSDTTENAWSGGDNLVNKVDYIKQLGIKEANLRRKADIYKGLKERLERSVRRTR